MRIAFLTYNRDPSLPSIDSDGCPVTARNYALGLATRGYTVDIFANRMDPATVPGAYWKKKYRLQARRVEKIAAGVRFDLVANFGGLNSRMRYHESYLRHVVEKMATISSRYVAFNVLVDAEPGFFPKGNQHTVGHVTDIPSTVLRDIVAQVSRNQGFSETVRMVQIFPKCHDAFVVMERRV